jgi:hypothetical protein
MFFELLLSNEPFYILLGSDSIHGSSDSSFFGQKARTRSSLNIRDSTRHYCAQCAADTYQLGLISNAIQSNEMALIRAQSDLAVK